MTISDKKTRAIECFVSIFGGSYQKLSPTDVDYKIFDKDMNFIGYADVNVLVKTIISAYPLPAEARRVVKLIDKRVTPILIWGCEDGIIYGKANEVIGSVKMPNSKDLMSELTIYYNKQKAFKYVRYK